MNFLNYHVEIFGWWILVMIVVFILCYNGGLLIEKYAPKRWRSDNGYLNNGVEETIGTLVVVIFMIFCIISMLPVYPTYFSSPTVQVTADGKIIPITHPVWIWNIPQDSTYVRLEDTFGCNLWPMDGETNNGIRIEGYPESDYGFVYRFTDHAIFYKYYKIGGISSFCKELKTVAFNETLAGKIIYPESHKLIAVIEQEQADLKNHLREVLKEKFQDKGIVPVMK